MNQEKISNQKLLYCILGLFFTVFTGIVVITYSYFNKVKELFEQSLNQKMCIENLDIQKISYESFISQHYQIQSNWITFWLAFTGIVLTLVTIIMPIIAMKNNEKQEEKLEKQEEKFNDIKTKLESQIEIAEERLNRLDINKVNIEFNKSIEDTKQKLKETIDSVTDNLWEKIDAKKEELISSIKSIILEDILKNETDTDYFLDKLKNAIYPDIAYILEEKLKGDSSYE